MRILNTHRATFTESFSHGAAEPQLFKRLMDREEFQTNWIFIDAAILLPGSGIGHHSHSTNEEIFVTIDNAAQFTHNGRTTQVEGGAAVPSRLGESHGICNPTQTNLELFALSVCMEKGTVDCIV